MEFIREDCIYARGSFFLLALPFNYPFGDFK